MSAPALEPISVGNCPSCGGFPTQCIEDEDGGVEYRRIDLHTDSMSILQGQVHEWANDTFPDRVPANAWQKMFIELGEVIENPGDPLEWGDVMIMLFDLAKMHGVDLYGATQLKLEVNRLRSWTRLPSGVYRHTEQLPGEPVALVEGGGCAPPVAVALPRPPSNGHHMDRTIFRGGPYDRLEILGRLDWPGAHKSEHTGAVSAWYPGGDGDGGCYVVESVVRDPVASGGLTRIFYKWNSDGVPF